MPRAVRGMTWAVAAQKNYYGSWFQTRHRQYLVGSRTQLAQGSTVRCSPDSVAGVETFSDCLRLSAILLRPLSIGVRSTAATVGADIAADAAEAVFVFTDTPPNLSAADLRLIAASLSPGISTVTLETAGWVTVGCDEVVLSVAIGAVGCDVTAAAIAGIAAVGTGAVHRPSMKPP